MALSTLEEIKAAAADWLNRSDLTAQIDDFSTLAVEEIYRKLKIPYTNSVLDYTVTASDETNGYFDLPDQNISVISITDSQGRRLQAVTFEDYRGYTGTAGTPCVYASVADRIYIGPSTSENEVYTIYHETASGGAGPIVTNMPETLLMGILMFACLFLKDDERAKLYKIKFQEGLNDHNMRGTGGAGRSRIKDHSISVNGGPLV
jgi:hypothetical protein